MGVAVVVEVHAFKDGAVEVVPLTAGRQTRRDFCPVAESGPAAVSRVSLQADLAYAHGQVIQRSGLRVESGPIGVMASFGSPNRSRPGWRKAA